MTVINKSQQKNILFKIHKTFNVFLYCSVFENILVKMSVVPHGAFAVRKVRKNEEKLKKHYDVLDLNPTKYSSKYMNSIWGMYNRYSVHNFKKNMDEKAFTFMVPQESCGPKQSVDRSSTDYKGSLSSATSFLPSPGFL